MILIDTQRIAIPGEIVRRMSNMENPYYDYCYECTGYGNDYYLDENGEWVSACDDCPINDLREEDD